MAFPVGNNDVVPKMHHTGKMLTILAACDHAYLRFKNVTIPFYSSV